MAAGPALVLETPELLDEAVAPATEGAMGNASSAAPEPTAHAWAAFLEVEQSVLDAVPTGLCVCDAEGLLRRYNACAVALWGRTPRLNDPREVDGGTFRRFAPDGSPLPFAASPVGVALRTGATLRDAELAIERPDGSRVPVLISVAPLKNAAGRI